MGGYDGANRNTSRPRVPAVNPVAVARLFDPLPAFDHPATLVLLAVAAVPLVLAPIVIRLLPAEARADAWRRYTPWLVLVPVMAVPLLLGAAWMIAGVLGLAVLCFREYARATGLFRETFICYLVLLGIVLVHLAALDNWPQLTVALFPLAIAAVAGFAALQDRPKGYVQRVALGVFAFTLFGSCLGHLSWLATDTHFRPRIALVLLAIGFWDVARYTTEKLAGGPRLCPRTSPDRTWAGAILAAVVVVGLVIGLGSLVFAGTPLGEPAALALFGLLIALTATLGDLMLAAIKRDVGVTDLDITIPGHGSLLDRFDSLILVSPVAFHFVNYLVGVGVGQPVCVFTHAR